MNDRDNWFLLYYIGYRGYTYTYCSPDPDSRVKGVGLGVERHFGSCEADRLKGASGFLQDTQAGV